MSDSLNLGSLIESPLIQAVSALYFLIQEHGGDVLKDEAEQALSDLGVAVRITDTCVGCEE